MNYNLRKRIQNIILEYLSAIIFSIALSALIMAAAVFYLRTIVVIEDYSGQLLLFGGAMLLLSKLVAIKANPKNSRLLKTGIATQGKILAVRETGWSRRRNPAVELELTIEIRPFKGPRTTALIKKFIANKSINAYQVGDHIPMRYHQEHPEVMEIDLKVWDDTAKSREHEALIRTERQTPKSITSNGAEFDLISFIKSLNIQSIKERYLLWVAKFENSTVSKEEKTNNHQLEMHLDEILYIDDNMEIDNSPNFIKQEIISYYLPNSYEHGLLTTGIPTLGQVITVKQLSTFSNGSIKLELVIEFTTEQNKKTQGKTQITVKSNKIITVLENNFCVPIRYSQYYPQKIIIDLDVTEDEWQKLIIKSEFCLKKIDTIL